MGKASKTAWYEIDDYWGDYTSGPRMLGVVRCPDGDRAEYDRLIADMLNALGLADDGLTLAEPVWRWYRMNPDPTGEYGWLLGRPTGPGRGNWVGAAVITNA